MTCDNLVGKRWINHFNDIENCLSLILRLTLHRPSYTETEPGRGHFISKPQAAVALHKWAETGDGTFQQLGSQLEEAVGRPHRRQTKPSPRPSGCHRTGELVTLAASSLEVFKIERIWISGTSLESCSETQNASILRVCPVLCLCIMFDTCKVPLVSEGTLKTSQDAQLEAYCHAAEVRDKHPENHNVHEDGVGSQVRQGREGPQGGQALRQRRAGILQFSRGT